MGICLDPKSIYKEMQKCADGIAISPCDLKNLESVDETLDFLMGEILPALHMQIGHIHGLREKLRVEKYE